jgi:hypothetical protein
MMHGHGSSQNNFRLYRSTVHMRWPVLKRYQSCYLGDQGGGCGLHPTVIITYGATQPPSDSRLATKTTNNNFFHSDRPERKKNQVSKRNTNKRWEGILVYISLLTTNKPSRIYVRCVTILYGNCPVSRVITTRKLYKSRRNIQYLNTLIELKRFERCVGTQVQFVLEKKRTVSTRAVTGVSDTTTYL